MNNLGGRVILFTLAGIAAGFLTWFFSDLSGLIHLPDTAGQLTREEMLQQNLVSLAFGAFLAILLGVADTLASGLQGRWLQVLGYGLIVGALAGTLGIQFGMALFGLFYSERMTNPLTFLGNVFARALGWAFIGGLAGTADGIRKWSGRVIRNGAIGGLIGGLVGGTVFEIIPYLLVGVRSPAVVSRLFGFIITGALVGLFIALVQQLLKEAWIRVVVGRNEGKEFLVEKAETKIGRAELSDVPLFGDPNIARTHAVLAADGSRFILRDVSQSPLGILVNGEKIEGERPVRNGDQIQIGGKTLIFFERLTKERSAPTPKDVARPAVPRDPGVPSLADSLPAPTPLPIGAAAMGMRSPMGPATTGASRLVAISGPYTGTSFALRAGAVLGRDPAADIPLPADNGASRRHARIVQEALSFAIEDAGSTNGTFVNGQRISRQALVPGDMVAIGGTQLRVE